MARAPGVILSLVAGGLGVALVWAGDNHVGSRKVAGWDPDQFIWLSTAALIATVVAGVVSGRRLRSDAPPSTTHLVDVIAALVVSVGAAFTISSAVAAERQNYWDAIHFSTLAWTGILSAVVATVVSAMASRRGDGPVQALGWLPGAVLSGWLLLWMVTWFQPLGDLLAWIASTWYLATHG